MGMFDGAFSFGDPNSMALLGMLSGLGQSASASRLPVTFGSALGSLAGGAMQGSMLGQEAQLKGQEAFGKQLQNTQLLDNLRLMALGYGLPAPTMADIQSGKYQGLFSGGLPKSLMQSFETPTTTPAAPASAIQPMQGYTPPAPGVGGAVSRAAAADASALSSKLLQMGYTPTQAAAVLGNAAAESSLNSADTSGDGGTSQGLFQWHAPERKAGLQAYAQKTGRPWTDPHLQLEYMDQELRQKAPEFFQSPDLASATKLFQDKFEIPAKDTSQHRTQLAQNFLGQMTGTDAGPQVAQAQQPQGGAMFAPDTLRAMLNANMKRYMGYQLTPVEQNLLAAGMAPAGSQQRSLAEAAALKAAGIDQFKGGERPGNPIFKYNPTTGVYEVSGLNPATAPGSAYIPGAGGGLGGIVQIPGATAAERAFAVAKQLPGTPMGAELQQGPQGLTMGLVPGAPEAIGGSVGAQAWGGVPAKLYEAGQTPRTLSPTESLVVPGQLGAGGAAGAPQTYPPTAGGMAPGGRAPGVLQQGLNPLYAKGVETAVTADQERISKELTPMVDKANDQMATAQLIGDLLPRVATGWGAETKLEAARVMKGLGVSDDTVKNFLGTNAASGDVLQKQFLAQTAQAVRVMGAREPGSVISLFGKAYPNLATQPGAISLIENVLMMQGQRAHDQFALAQQHHSEQVNGLSSGQPYVPLSKFESEFNTGAHSSVNYLKAAQALASDRVAWQGLKPEQVDQVWSLIPSGRQYVAPDGSLKVKQ